MSSGNTKLKLNIRGHKRFCSQFAINHICQSITGVIESVAEVVSACHIWLMRCLIVPLLKYWTLPGQYLITSNCPRINIWTLKRAVWPPGSLFAQAALYFDQLEGNRMTRPNFKQHFCGRASSAPPLCAASQMDLGSTQLFASSFLCTAHASYFGSLGYFLLCLFFTHASFINRLLIS